MSDQFKSFRASLGPVFYRPSAFSKLMQKKMDKIIDLTEQICLQYLDTMGEKTAQKSIDIIESSIPAGKEYEIVDEEGIVIDSWKASAEGQPPAVFTENLIDHITYRIISGGRKADYVEIGVFSEEEWEYRTIAFYGANKEEDEESKPKLVVGPGGHIHKVKDYAKALEEGFVTKKGTYVPPRPFLKPAFDEVIVEQRKELQKEIKDAFTYVFGKKIPITFRIYFKKKELSE